MTSCDEPRRVCQYHVLCARGRWPWRRQSASSRSSAAMSRVGRRPPPPPPGSPFAVVRIVLIGPTARRSDLSASAQACANGVGATHTHPSWRNFAAIPLQPAPPDRHDISFTDVPANTRVSFRVNDQNSCDENPTGAVTRNIFVNNMRLIQNATTPGNGDEPEYAFTIAPDGTIRQ
jgi:hypothetical protein